MASDSEAKRRGDLLKWCVNPEYCIETHLTKAATSASFEVGSPVDDSTGDILITNSNEANVEGICLTNVEATGGEKIQVLVRGPAIIDENELHLESDVTAAELEATLNGLGIIYFPVNATSWTTQTT